ncbi:MAG: response regulator, partial [Deltaproteobacteria bacterium]|nr:response regulator [Deltaproteobacteria bacterium]
DHDITIIAMTANAMQEDRETCLAAGMDDYIAKPINKKKVFEVIEKQLKKSVAQRLQDRRTTFVSGEDVAF